MPRNEYIWADGFYLVVDARLVAARAAAYVGHHDPETFAFEYLCLGIYYPRLAPVDITIDSLQRLECGYFVCRLDRAEVSGMPYLVDTGKEPPQFIVETTMGIGYDPYLFHYGKDRVYIGIYNPKVTFVRLALASCQPAVTRRRGLRISLRSILPPPAAGNYKANLTRDTIAF